MTVHDPTPSTGATRSGRDLPLTPASPAVPLSEAAGRFYAHVDAHPELLERSTFAPLLERLRDLVPDLDGKLDDRYRLQPWPTLMSEDRWNELAAANLAMTRLVRSLPERVFGGDPRAVAEYYRLDSAETAALLLSEPNAIFETLARGDWVDTAEGIRCLEINFGNLGSWQNASLSPRYLAAPAIEAFREAAGVEMEWTDTAGLFLRHVVDHCRATLDLSAGELNVVMTMAEEVSGLDFTPLSELYGERLAEILATVGEPANGRVTVTVPSRLELDDGLPILDGAPVHALVDQSIGRMRPDLLRELFRAFKSGRMQLYSGPISLILSHKKNLALLSRLAGSSLFTAEERELIRRYVPFTRAVAPGPTDDGGRPVLLPDLLRAEKDRFVLKGGMSVGGAEVVVGRTVDAAAWERTLSAALSDGGWVAQELLETPVYRYQSGARGSSPHRTVWGVFAFGDTPAGMFVRLSETTNSPVVNISRGAEAGLAFVARTEAPADRAPAEGAAGTGEADRASRPLSPAAARFYEYVERRPELFERETFEPLFEQLAERIPDLGGKPGGPYGLQPWPTLMTAERWEELAQANLAIARLVRSLPERIFAGDPDEVADFYGLESAGLASLLLSEPTAIFETPVRGDWVDTAGGIRCLEMNFGNLGSWQNASLSDLYLDWPAMEAFRRDTGIELEWTHTARLMLEHIVDHCRATLDLGTGELNVAMAVAEGDADLIFAHPEELYDRELAAILAAGEGSLRGRVVVTVPSEIEVDGGVPKARGVPIHALVDQSDQPASRELFRAFKAGRIQLFSGPIILLLAHKKNLALLSRLADSGLFDDEERRTIHRYVPFTRVLASDPTEYRGRQVLLPELLRREKDRFVLKGGMSIGGRDVHVGRRMDAEEWDATLRAGLADGSWVAQEFLDTETYLYQGGERGSTPHRCVWGIFALGDRPAGLFVRLSEVANSPVVNISQGAEVGLAFVAREGTG